MRPQRAIQMHRHYDNVAFSTTDMPDTHYITADMAAAFGRALITAAHDIKNRAFQYSAFPSGELVVKEGSADTFQPPASPKMLGACEAALALIKDTWGEDHGNPQVGKAWGALEDAIREANQ